MSLTGGQRLFFRTILNMLEKLGSFIESKDKFVENLDQRKAAVMMLAFAHNYQKTQLGTQPNLWGEFGEYNPFTGLERNALAHNRKGSFLDSKAAEQLYRFLMYFVHESNILNNLGKILQESEEPLEFPGQFVETGKRDFSRLNSGRKMKLQARYQLMQSLMVNILHNRARINEGSTYYATLFDLGRLAQLLHDSEPELNSFKQTYPKVAELANKLWKFRTNHIAHPSTMQDVNFESMEAKVTQAFQQVSQLKSLFSGVFCKPDNKSKHSEHTDNSGGDLDEQRVHKQVVMDKCLVSLGNLRVEKNLGQFMETYEAPTGRVAIGVAVKIDSRNAENILFLMLLQNKPDIKLFRQLFAVLSPKEKKTFYQRYLLFSLLAIPGADEESVAKRLKFLIQNKPKNSTLKTSRDAGQSVTKRTVLIQAIFSFSKQILKLLVERLKTPVGIDALGNAWFHPVIGNAIENYQYLLEKYMSSEVPESKAESIAAMWGGVLLEPHLPKASFDYLLQEISRHPSIEKIILPQEMSRILGHFKTLPTEKLPTYQVRILRIIVQNYVVLTTDAPYPLNVLGQVISLGFYQFANDVIKATQKDRPDKLLNMLVQGTSHEYRRTRGPNVQLCVLFGESARRAAQVMTPKEIMSQLDSDSSPEIKALQDSIKRLSTSADSTEMTDDALEKIGAISNGNI